MTDNTKEFTDFLESLGTDFYLHVSNYSNHPNKVFSTIDLTVTELVAICEAQYLNRHSKKARNMVDAQQIYEVVIGRLNSCTSELREDMMAVLSEIDSYKYSLEDEVESDNTWLEENFSTFTNSEDDSNSNLADFYIEGEYFVKYNEKKSRFI